MKQVYFLLFIAIQLAAAPSNISAQIFIGETEVDTSTVASNLDTPWEILWGPDDHIWMTERMGRISKLDPQTGEISEVGQIGEAHEQGEAGLLGPVSYTHLRAHET